MDILKVTYNPDTYVAIYTVNDEHCTKHEAV